VVQLKAFANTKLDAQNFVSIPCGSIKSEYSRECVTWANVSIPCGSIKRSHPYIIITGGIWFQFLVVQLKVQGGN